jgi:hypothetical protein
LRETFALTLTKVFVLVRGQFFCFSVRLCALVMFIDMRLFEMQHFFVNTCGQRLAGQPFNHRAIPRSNRGHGWRVVRVTVIVIFEIFENVADVQESVAI